MGGVSEVGPCTSFSSEYSLVVLLKFRDKRTHEARTVADLFYYPLPELQSDIIRDIVLSGGHGLFTNP